MKLRVIKVIAVDEDGVVLDQVTMRIDPKWTGLGIAFVDPKADVRHEYVLELGRPE